ncbi:hypothetical protein DQ04_07031000 [Trypanosoma grayi]|uniref:hypothetical protein n=1 Tax=Trypanosoma grayi TaxID=71804 RepID=UPI0004F45E2D|nr:hypothetical protein DQ04_07031000 [Trypanosoma grayi]KEG08504.1 hypothetical protein DQ04_07031000 [Trypanosoma grayi]
MVGQGLLKRENRSLRTHGVRLTPKIPPARSYKSVRVDLLPSPSPSQPPSVLHHRLRCVCAGRNSTGLLEWVRAFPHHSANKQCVGHFRFTRCISSPTPLSLLLAHSRNVWWAKVHQHPSTPTTTTPSSSLPSSLRPSRACATTTSTLTALLLLLLLWGCQPLTAIEWRQQSGSPQPLRRSRLGS